MVEEKIYCPHCKKEISLTETLVNQIKDGARKEFEEETRLRDAELKRREEELLKRSREVDKEVSSRLTADREKLVNEARKKAREESIVELRSLKEENLENEKRIEEFRRSEIELRTKARQLEEEKKEFELKIARTMDAEREKIRRETLESYTEEHRLKDLEKDKKISDLVKLTEELKRKAEQGSMQTQGEVLELDLESMLRARFPVDVIEPVPKGIKGADILQRVHTRNGQLCGTIAWESKRTKNWSDDWVTKLKDDQREVKAEAAVLVSETLPKGINTFAMMEGVWVTGVQLAGSLAEALRVGLIQVAQTRTAASGKEEKMEAVYNYLTGSEFRHKIEAMVEGLKAMKEDLDREKRATIKSWAVREKQMERVVENIANMFGDMQGIVGKTLPEIKSFELGEGDAAEPEEAD